MSPKKTARKIRIGFMNASLTCAVLVLVSAHPAFAQEDIGPKGPVVKMAPAAVLTAPQAKATTVCLLFNVLRGYHINSNHPKSEYLIPTALKIDATTDIVVGKIIYPDGVDQSFAFSPDEKLNVYTGDFKVGVVVHPLHSVQPGKYVIRGTLRYQACDNTACYPPNNLPISFEVKIAKAPPAHAPNPAQSPHAHN